MSNFADREGLIWYDGEWVDWQDAKTHVLTHTLHYGMGVFEGVEHITPMKVQLFLGWKIIQIDYLIQPRL